MRHVLAFMLSTTITKPQRSMTHATYGVDCNSFGRVRSYAASDAARVCNGRTHPVDESTLARYNVTSPLIARGGIKM